MWLTDILFDIRQFVIPKLLNVIEISEGRGCGSGDVLKLSWDICRIWNERGSKATDKFLVSTKVNKIFNEVVRVVNSLLYDLDVPTESSEKIWL